jgi:hypothetical protein
MIFFEQKYFQALGLINTFVLIMSVYLLERERERFKPGVARVQYRIYQSNKKYSYTILPASYGFGKGEKLLSGARACCLKPFRQLVLIILLTHIYINHLIN